MKLNSTRLDSALEKLKNVQQELLKNGMGAYGELITAHQAGAEEEMSASNLYLGLLLEPQLIILAIALTTLVTFARQT